MAPPPPPSAEKPAAPPLVEASGISVRFGGHEVLREVALAIHRGEIVTIIGPNGAGKSTLLRVMLGLLRPDRGAVRPAAGLRIGYMPQRLAVDPTLPLTVGRFLRLGGGGGRAELLAVLGEVGASHICDKPIQEVSGGELQRILLARALLRNPDLLVLDEPMQGVDVTGQGELYRRLAEIRDRHHCGILMVSHDLHLVMAATDRVICLNHHVCCSGHPDHVSRDPAYHSLFGLDRAPPGLAVYHHHHDHRHGADGTVLPTAAAAQERPDE